MSAVSFLNRLIFIVDKYLRQIFQADTIVYVKGNYYSSLFAYAVILDLILHMYYEQRIKLNIEIESHAYYVNP